MEADRIWNALGQPARDELHRHALLGEYLAIGFGVLAVWRIMIQSFGFMAGSRAIYLIVAILAIVMLGYSAYLGGVLVYDYGAGTALMAAAPVPSESASPSAEASPAGPIPTVTVPTAIATSTQTGTPSAPEPAWAACRLRLNRSTVGRAECEHVMQTKANPEQSLEVADRLFKSIERGDIAAIREIDAPDVKIWTTMTALRRPSTRISRCLAGWSPIYRKSRTQKFDGMRLLPDSCSSM